MSVVRPIGHEDRLSLVEHLDELRRRLILCVVVFMGAFALCYWQNDRVLEIVNEPLDQAQRVECKGQIKDPLEKSACFNRQLGIAAKATADFARSVARDPGVSTATERAAREAARELDRAAASTPRTTGRQPVTLGVTEPFLTTITVAAYAALLLALPFLLWQAYAFVLPAFTPSERRIALPLMSLVPILFLAGVSFGYFVALPRAVDFLQNYNDDNFDILLQARDYYRFSIVLLAVMGLLFQIPVGVLAVVRLGVISTARLRASRGYVILGIAVVAAVATPTPDPVTMLIAMAPLLVLFELSVLLARLFEPKEPRWSWGDEDDEELTPDELD
ncbi:MAG: twin-arginine translocase subunit TatC [Solirubrobacterales bacterium]|nr:twin-arginine translocase subunit TatC [Solirubrobacterales bacterium]